MGLFRPAHLILELTYMLNQNLFVNTVSSTTIQHGMYPTTEVASQLRGPTSQRSIVGASKSGNKIGKCFGRDAMGKTSSRMAFRTFYVFYNKDGEDKKRLAQSKEVLFTRGLQL